MADEVQQTPPTVIGAIAAGVAPVPFLLTYAVVFLAHGTVFPVDPPDITTTRGGEALAGVVALAFLIFVVVGLGCLLSGRTRWPFLLGQAITLGVALDFVLDSSSGDPEVPLLLVLTAAAALVFGCLPPSWSWAGGRRRARGQLVDDDGVDDEHDVGTLLLEPDSQPVDPNSPSRT